MEYFSIHLHVYICANLRQYTRTQNSCAYTHMYVSSYIHKYVYAYTHTHTQIHIHIYMLTYTQTDAYVYIYIYIYIHIYIYIYIIQTQKHICNHHTSCTLVNSSIVCSFVFFFPFSFFLFLAPWHTHSLDQSFVHLLCLFLRVTSHSRQLSVEPTYCKYKYNEISNSHNEILSCFEIAAHS